jgi:hypothetical protein
VSDRKTGIGPGFANEARELRAALNIGAITLSEYREGMRLAGLPLKPDDQVFRPPPPLPPWSEGTGRLGDDEYPKWPDEGEEPDEGDDT